ncbi:BspA family leucine-rich repeat surface protein [Helicobacter colisuis]
MRDMRYMFSMCASFKGDLNSWDISNLKETYGMFGGCNCTVPSWYNKMKG